jgi:hypothetical protein
VRARIISGDLVVTWDDGTVENLGRIQGPRGPRGHGGGGGVAGEGGSGGGIEEAPIDGTTYGRKDAGWVAVAAGSGLTDGTYGDVIVSGGGTIIDIRPDTVGNVELQNMLEATIKGRAVGAGTGDPQDLTRAQSTEIINTFTSALKGSAPASGGGSTNYLRADGTWAVPPGTGGVTDGDKGDITVTGGIWEIDANTVSNTEAADMPTARIKGRVTAGTGDPEDLTGTQATTLLDVFTSSLKGLAPSSGGGSTNYLRADGTWAVPPGSGGITDGDKGDITVTGGVWEIDPGVVGNAELRDSVALSVIGRASNSTGDPADIAAASDGQVLRRSGTALAFGAVDLSSANAITGDLPFANLAQIATARILGRVTASTGDVEALTGTQATTLLDVFTSSLKGLAPSSGGGSTNFLRADGTWAVPPGSGGITDGDKGDITVTGGVWEIDAGAVGNAELRDSAGLSVIGRSANVSGDPADITAANDNEVLRRSGTAIGFGAVNLASSSAVTGDLPLANLAPAAAASRILGRGSAGGAGDWEALTVSSPIVISGTVVDFDETVTLDNNARVGVRKNSTGSIFTRRRINLIEGSNVTLTVADDSVAEEVDVTIAATGGGGGTPGGSDTQLQYNNGGAFGGMTNFAFDDAINKLSVSSGSTNTVSMEWLDHLSAAWMRSVNAKRLEFGASGTWDTAIYRGGTKRLTTLGNLGADASLGYGLVNPIITVTPADGEFTQPETGLTAIYNNGGTAELWVRNGSTWQQIGGGGGGGPTTNQKTADIELILGDGSSVVSTGIAGDLRVSFAGTITAAYAYAKETGSIAVDVWKDTHANYPPVDADSITASAPITLSSATKSEDTTLSGWTTSVAAGDILRFNVDSATTVTRVTIGLRIVKT